MNAIEKLKLASNGEDFMLLAEKIIKSDKNNEVKISGLENIIENVYMKIRRLNGEWDNEPNEEAEQYLSQTKGGKIGNETN